MRPLLLAIVLLLCRPAYGQSSAMTAHAETLSAQGSIQLPSLQSMRLDLLYSSEFSFTSPEELNQGKLLTKFLKATIISNIPWVVNVMAAGPYFHTTSPYSTEQQMPVSVLSFKSDINPAFQALSDKPQPILFSTSNNIMNEHFVDFKLNPGWQYPGGQYTTSIIFTLTSQ